MNVKILGPGCPKCNRLEQLTRAAAAALGITPDFEHLTEPAEIMKYPVVATPALVIDGKVVVAGRMPSPAELEAWLRGT